MTLFKNKNTSTILIGAKIPVIPKQNKAKEAEIMFKSNEEMFADFSKALNNLGINTINEDGTERRFPDVMKDIADLWEVACKNNES